MNKDTYLTNNKEVIPMKKVHCFEEGYCFTEEEGKLEIITPTNQEKYSLIALGAVFLGIVALAFI